MFYASELYKTTCISVRHNAIFLQLKQFFLLKKNKKTVFFF